MPPIADGSTAAGLHLGWIPNDPGRRPRDYPQQPPTAPEPDPAKLRRVQDGQHWSGLRRVLVVSGALALILFGGLGAISHKPVFWEVAAGLAVVCWLGTLASALFHRRAVRALNKDQARAMERHALALEAHSAAVREWRRAEMERVASAPHWLRVSSAESARRLDVFGGTARGRTGMLAGLGGALLDRHAVIVLDLSAEQVCDGLVAAAREAGLPYSDYQLPRDLRATPLLAGLTGEQVASQIVEVLHADDRGATTAARATDLMVMRKVVAVLGDDVTMRRLHEALTCVLAGTPVGAPGGRSGASLGEDAVAALAAQFPGDFRREVAASLIRLAAVVEPLRDLGADATPRPPARLTCLSLEEGPRDVASDLTAALVVQWATSAILASVGGDSGGAGAGGASGGGSAGGGSAGRPAPAVVLAGADEQATRHLQRLTAVCQRYGVPLIRTFSRLSEESARHLDTRNTAFMRLPTRAEALRAAEHIGLERRFVAGRFSHTRSVSQSRTVTRGESVTHTTGYAEGEAITKTTGTTRGEALTETVVKRHNDRAHDRAPSSDHDNSKARPSGGSRSVSGDSRPARAASGHAASDDAGGGKGGKQGGGKQGGGRHAPYVFDFMTSRTKFKFTHQSEAKTQSWTRTEESSHTQTREFSNTDGTSTGDEITYELTYDHKVAPETLMDLPEDQMLAPDIVESVAAGEPASAALAAEPAQGKMIALVVNPEVIGSAPVAHVHPGEIPAFQPPPPALSREVPESLRALTSGS